MKTPKTDENVVRANWLLRIGLAFVFLYAAYSSLRTPAAWVSYLPAILTENLSATVLLKFLAIYELLLAVWLIIGKYIRYAALLASVTLLGIVIGNLDAMVITFRDIGLVFAALALCALNWDN